MVMQFFWRLLGSILVGIGFTCCLLILMAILLFLSNTTGINFWLIAAAVLAVAMLVYPATK